MADLFPGFSRMVTKSEGSFSNRNIYVRNRRGGRLEGVTYIGGVQSILRMQVCIRQSEAMDELKAAAATVQLTNDIDEKDRASVPGSHDPADRQNADPGITPA